MAEFNKYSCIDPYIRGDAETCSYCDHLDPLILLEGKHMYITLAIGQIREGYLMVSSQKHRISATGLLSYETNELIKMKQVIRCAYKEVYGIPGIAFEHGRAGSCLWGKDRHKNASSLCYHCHIHFVPIAIDIRPRIKEFLSQEIIVKNIYELKKVRKDILQAEPYLYFEDNNEIGYVYPVADEEIPRQFLRSCVASELGEPLKADWMSYPGTELFDISKHKLQPALLKYWDLMV